MPLPTDSLPVETHNSEAKTAPDRRSELELK